jgi:ribosomal protein S18 acetylase RimI-like enzyme
MNELMRLIRATGVGTLTVNSLTPDDLPAIAWAGNPAHLRSVAHNLTRAASGLCDYLAVRAPDGTPLAIGQINYDDVDELGAGVLCQLAVNPELQGLGLGTRLISAAEQRILTRGLHRAVIGVETDNTRAQVLYERLGYQLIGRETDSWEVQDEQGNVHTHLAEVLLLKKDLSRAPGS